jgi:GWxTD domain-containing protein
MPFRVASLCLGLLVASRFAAAQGIAPTDSNAAFFSDLVVVRGDDSLARVDVYLQIPYQNLQFQRDGSVFHAHLEFEIAVESGEKTVEDKTQRQSIDEADYDVTTGKTGKSAFIQRSLHLPPGDYRFTLTVTDEQTKNSSQQRKPLHVADYRSPRYAFGGILLASRIENIGGKRSITPYILPTVGVLPDGIFLFYELYGREKTDTVDIVWRAVGKSGDEATRSSRRMTSVAGPPQRFARIETNDLSRGIYHVTIGAFPHSADTSARADFDHPLAEISRDITIEWGSGIPQNPDDLDRAITQLRWIALEDEIDHIKEGATIDERRRRFIDFWKAHDPSPGTPRNEALEDYYKRIQYANEHFHSYTEGWLSDQGMISIIFGTPSSIDRHPFETIQIGPWRGPYEIWYYDQYNRKYVFIDQSSFGDFRLASPPPTEKYRYGR